MIYFLCSVDWVGSSSAGFTWAHSCSCIHLEGSPGVEDPRWPHGCHLMLTVHCGSPAMWPPYLRLAFIAVSGPVLKVSHGVTSTTMPWSKQVTGSEKIQGLEKQIPSFDVRNRKVTLQRSIGGIIAIFANNLYNRTKLCL